MLRSIIQSRIFILSKQHSFSSLGAGQDLLADVLQDGGRPKTILEGYSSTGFEVGNETIFEGSVLALPYSKFIYKPRKPAEVTVDSLKCFTVVNPSIEMVFFGSDVEFEQEKREEVRKWGRESGVKVEFMGVGNASATFNILNGEDRRIGACLLTSSSS